MTIKLIVCTTVLYVASSSAVKLVDDVEARLKVAVAILVGLDPALRDVSPPLLHDGVEPGEREHRLAVGGVGSPRIGSPRVEGPLQVSLDAGRGLIGYLEARFAEDGREFGVRLCRQPKPGNKGDVDYL